MKDDYGDWDIRLRRGASRVKKEENIQKKHPCAYCHESIFFGDKHTEDWGLQFCRLQCRDEYGKLHGKDITGFGKTVIHTAEMQLEMAKE